MERVWLHLDALRPDFPGRPIPILDKSITGPAEITHMSGATNLTDLTAKFRFYPELRHNLAHPFSTFLSSFMHASQKYGAVWNPGCRLIFPGLMM